VVTEIDRLIDHHTDAEIADILNARGVRPGVADRFSITIIYQLRMKYRLENRFSRLRRQGLLTLEEMAAASGLHPTTVKDRATKGYLASYVYNDRGQRLYEPPAQPNMIACHHCAKPISERGKNGQWQKYCDATCSMKAYAHRKAAGLVRVRRRPE
jgi:ribosomal protein L37AE/L43A